MGQNIFAGRKILIVDDDADLSMIARDMLEDYGYQVMVAKTSDEAYEKLKTNTYHLIILDINLPQTTGFEVCRELRKISTVPVIFCSARTSADDRITGLDIGGDDYIAKPYSLRELLSRTNSLMRRTYGFEESSKIIVIGTRTDNEIIISTGNREVTRNGEKVNLALKEYDLLLYLAEHIGNTIKKNTLLAEVWGALSEVELSTLTVHIRWLREKIEKDPSKPDYIKTVWGIGYMLEDGGEHGE